MKMAEKIALRVLMVALLAVVGLVARPGASLAQSALQVVPIEGIGSYNFGEGFSEPRITNPTTMPLCANVYLFYADGSPYDCYSVPVPPFASADDYSSICTGNDEDCIFNFEGSFFIVSGVPDPNGNCSPWAAHPKAGLRSWLMIDENGAIGVNAQDAVLSSDVLRGLMRACYGAPG